MSNVVDTADYIRAFATSPLAPWQALAPWQLCERSVEVVRELLRQLQPADYVWAGDVAVHRTATVEAGAVLKGPLILGAGCFVAAGAYLRGGNWCGDNCNFGPGAELKSSFVFSGTTLAHFNFVGDSLLGESVNLEAGSVICNCRNERGGKLVRVRVGGGLHATGCDKFGALVGDACRIGANAVVAPGALLPPASVVRRTALIDQEDTPQ